MLRLRMGIVALTLSACSASLTDAQWLWCKDKADSDEAVLVAAEGLGVQKVTRSVTQTGPPWMAYLGDPKRLEADPDFNAACDAVGQNPDEKVFTRYAWCVGINYDKVLDAAAKLGQPFAPHSSDVTRYGWQFLSDEEQRRTDTDFVRSCIAAFDSR